MAKAARKTTRKKTTAKKASTTKKATASKKSATDRKATTRKPRLVKPPVLQPTEEQIRERAYHIYVARNGAPGDPNLDWQLAEAQLRAELAGK